MKCYISAAFSAAMVLPLTKEGVNVKFTEVTDLGEIPASAGSCVGHADTAKVISNLLGFEVPFARVNVTLSKGDIMYVAQLSGGRLPEGSTTLPEGFTLTFLKVEVMDA